MPPPNPSNLPRPSPRPPLVECVPNFSEGRNPAVLEALRTAIASVPGVHLLDVHADTAHHRSVFTFVAPPKAAEEAAVRAAAVARDRIDLTGHRGQHPRIGATDVIPFAPWRGVAMEDCAAIARRVGERIGRELQIPVYLYAHAATRHERERLPAVRRGEFEGLAPRVGTDPVAEPDFGPRHVHPTAGATAVGARPILVAYNVVLETPDIAMARDIARSIRTSGGGLPAVQARGFAAGGRAQVSTNLMDVDVTPPATVFHAVQTAARARGVEIAGAELVGLIPERALPRGADAERIVPGGSARTLESLVRAAEEQVG